jgi:hypothetical protein
MESASQFTMKDVLARLKKKKPAGQGTATAGGFRHQVEEMCVIVVKSREAVGQCNPGAGGLH